MKSNLTKISLKKSKYGILDPALFVSDLRQGQKRRPWDRNGLRALHVDNQYLLNWEAKWAALLRYF